MTKNNDLVKRYKEIRNFVTIKFDEIEKIQDYDLKVICYFSMIDAFAQENANYPTSNNKKSFCDFLITYAGKKYNWIDDINPIILYYILEAKYINKDINGNKLIDISTLTSGYEYNINTINNDVTANYSLIKNNDLNKAKYCTLLYKMRSKHIHELSHSLICKIQSKRDVSEIGFMHTNDSKSNYEWSFYITSNMIRDIAIESINNFLNDREVKFLDPMENRKGRSIVDIWYN